MTTSAPASHLRRWWTYFRERFPLHQHGPLIAAFSFSAVSYSYMLRRPARDPGWPDLAAIVVAFVTCLIFFLQLRIADEFKDFEEDSRFRPYRPVPRGLVSLRELGVLFALGAAVQLALAMLLGWRLAVLLVGVWVYLALMSREFFIRDWIVDRPITYMWTHMLIMPLVDLYATACDWLPAEAGTDGAAPPEGLIWFLIVSFFNGMVIEIGRKIRAPQSEEEGVRTYSVLWGRGPAVAAWLTIMAATGGFAIVAASRITFTIPAAAAFIVTWIASAAIALRFHAKPTPTGGKLIEAMAGVWTLTLYLMLGAVPMAVRAVG